MLDAGNSGTTTRLLSGVLAAHPFAATITGDDSLRRRPMRRIIAPLTRMGARFESNDGCLPMTVTGGRLTPIDFTPDVPSAQVKSAVLLAGLQTEGCTTVHEPVPTRDHTELALSAFGVRVDRDGDAIRLEGLQALRAVETAIPGDVSSATFWAVAAAALPGSDLEIAGPGPESLPDGAVRHPVPGRRRRADRRRPRGGGRAARPRPRAPPRPPAARARARRSPRRDRRTAGTGGHGRLRRRAARHGRRRAARQGKRSDFRAGRGLPRDGRRDRGVPRRLPRARRSPSHRRTPGRRRRSPPGDGLCDRRPLGDRRHDRRWRRGGGRLLPRLLPDAGAR